MSRPRPSSARVHLLPHHILPVGEPVLFRTPAVQLIKEDSLTLVPQLVRALGIQQPSEDIRDLLLVASMPHNVEDVEASLLGSTE